MDELIQDADFTDDVDTVNTCDTEKEDDCGEQPEMADILPWHEPVNGQEMLDDMVALFNRHLVLAKGAPEVMALWCTFTCYRGSGVCPSVAVEISGTSLWKIHGAQCRGNAFPPLGTVEFDHEGSGVSPH